MWISVHENFNVKSRVHVRYLTKIPLIKVGNFNHPKFGTIILIVFDFDGGDLSEVKYLMNTTGAHDCTLDIQSWLTPPEKVFWTNKHLLRSYLESPKTHPKQQTWGIWMSEGVCLTQPKEHKNPSFNYMFALAEWSRKLFMLQISNWLDETNGSTTLLKTMHKLNWMISTIARTETTTQRMIWNSAEITRLVARTLLPYSHGTQWIKWESQTPRRFFSKPATFGSSRCTYVCLPESMLLTNWLS